MLALCEHSQSPSSFDTLFHEIPSILLTQTNGLYLVHLSDIISIYNQTPLENLDGLKQELYRLRGSVWRFFYLDYENLIKSSQTLLSCQSEYNEVSVFYKSFAFELNKVRDFCSVKGGEIERRLAFMKNTTSSNKGMANFIDMHDAMEELTYDIHDLWHFMKVNYRAFLGIVNFLDKTLGNHGQDQQQSNQIETNILLQRLYRLLVPNQFLEWNLFLHWCLDLGRLYQDQLAISSTSEFDNYNSSYCADNGSTHSSPHILFAPRMTRDSSNASTGSLPSSTAPPSPTLTIPPHDLPASTTADSPSIQHMYRHKNGEEAHDTYKQFSPSPTTPRSSDPPDWIDDITHAPPTSGAKGVPFTTMTQGSVFKFWIHPDNLVEVTMHLAKYLEAMDPQHISSSSYPIASFEIDSPEHQARYHGDSTHPQCTASSINIVDSSSAHHHSFRYWQPITTLYLDVPDMKGYSDRIRGIADDGYQQRTISTLRLRQYNNTNDNKQGANNDTINNNDSIPSSAHFYALEKKIYTVESCSNALVSSTGSTRSSGGSSKKLGKRPYRQYHQKQPLRRQLSTSSTLSASTMSSVPSVINSDQDKEYFLHHRSSSCLDPATKPSALSIHGRIWLKSKRCKPWLNHQWSLKNILAKSSPKHHYKMDGKQVANRKHIEQQVLEMELDLQKQHLKPVIRTSLNRIGFRWTDDQINIDGDQQKKCLTITIDTDITMMRSDDEGLAGKDPLQQQDYLCGTSSSNDLSRFPFAVLQINLPHDFSIEASSLPWLNQLFSCPMLEPVQNFSLYLHGVSTLLSDKVDIYPEWHDKMGLDLRQVEHQGYLTGIRRAYHPQQQRQYSNRSSKQEEGTISDPATPWSYITKGSCSPDAETVTPTESTPSCALPLHSLEHNILPTINYFTCTTTTTPPPTVRMEGNDNNRKPSIILSPAPLSSNTTTSERTPLLPSPKASMKSGTCSSSSSIRGTQQSVLPHHCLTTPSLLSPSSSRYLPTTPHHLVKVRNWIQFRLSAALVWFENKKDAKQQTCDGHYTAIDIPDEEQVGDWQAKWEETIIMARRPIPLTLLCGLGSFVVAYILYLLVDIL